MWRGSPETRLAVQLSFMHDAPGTPRLRCIVLLVGSFRVQGQDLPGSPYVALFSLQANGQPVPIPIHPSKVQPGCVRIRGSERV